MIFVFKGTIRFTFLFLCCCFFLISCLVVCLQDTMFDVCNSWCIAFQKSISTKKSTLNRFIAMTNIFHCMSNNVKVLMIYWLNSFYNLIIGYKNLDSVLLSRSFQQFYQCFSVREPYLLNSNNQRSTIQT